MAAVEIACPRRIALVGTVSTARATAVAALEVVLLREHQIRAFHVEIARFERDSLGLRRVGLMSGFEFDVRTHGQNSVAAAPSVQLAGTDNPGVLDVLAEGSDSAAVKSLRRWP